MSHFPIDHTVTRALLSELGHPAEDVLSTKQERTRRVADLYKAVSMESLYQRRVVFWIENGSCCFPILSRVVAVGDRSVFLERNIHVPIASICRIQFLDMPGVLFS